jgi:hypothetical protein
LVLVTTSCPLSSPVYLALDGGGNFGQIQIPGETRFEVPAGRHTLAFIRNGAIYVGPETLTGIVIPNGASVTITDPPGVCVEAPGH